jgi:soluble lytic murein transglycosylase-like protein
LIELLLTCSLLGKVDFEIDTFQDLYRVPYQCELIEQVQEWIPLVNIYFKKDEALALTVMYCESSGREKVIGKNTNGTFDSGLFQINSETEKWLENSIYNKELDMLNAETNVKAASWIVRNIGDWSWWNSSKHCWGRYDSFSR